VPGAQSLHAADELALLAVCTLPAAHSPRAVHLD
jgi:hypothetical protein